MSSDLFSISIIQVAESCATAPGLVAHAINVLEAAHTGASRRLLPGAALERVISTRVQNNEVEAVTGNAHPIQRIVHAYSRNPHVALRAHASLNRYQVIACSRLRLDTSGHAIRR